jgi:hypothetical protein
VLNKENPKNLLEILKNPKNLSVRNSALFTHVTNVNIEKYDENWLQKQL